MATIFTTDFSGVDFSEFDSTNLSRSSPFPYGGVGGAQCLTCCRGAGGAFGTASKVLAAIGAGSATFSARGQLSIFATTNFDAGLVYIYALKQTSAGPTDIFSTSVAILYDGTVRLYINQDGVSTAIIDSAAGLFPHDGSNHAIQTTFRCNGTASVDYIVELDGVTILSGNQAVTFSASGNLNTLDLVTYRNSTSGSVNVMTRWLEFTLTDTFGLVSYPVLTVPDLYVDFCDVPPVTEGTIIVEKVLVSPFAGPAFTINAGGGLSPSSFQLSDGESRQFDTVPAGSGYSIEEDPNSLYDTTYDVSNASPNDDITVAGGETVTVIITNTIKATLAWTQVSGPCTAVFSATNIPNPTVTFPCPGVYTFRLCATSECKVLCDDVVITVLAACVMPSASPFPDL